MTETWAGQRALQTPRAAGLAGVVFALLLAAAMVLIRLSIPQGAESVTLQGLTDPTRRSAVKAALALVPLAGICFLWFMGALRARMGEAEDQFLATVFLGSGLVFVATLFGAAAAAAGVLATTDAPGGTPGLPAWNFGRHFAYTLLTEYATRMAAVFTCSTSVICHRLRLLPRWLSLLGFLTFLTLLFVPAGVPWSELVFPGWSLLVGAFLFAAGRSPRPGTTAVS